MVYAVVVLAAVALGLAALLLRSQSQSKSLNASLNQVHQEAAANRDRLETEIKEKDALIDELERSAAAATSKIDELESAKRDAETKSTTAAERADAAVADTAAKDGELREAQQKLEELTTQNNALVDDRDSLKNEIESARSAPAIVLGDGHQNGNGSSPIHTLWDLEMARSERTWRHSVAINPENDPNPFDETDDPVRLAVEIEAAALRETVGSFITVDWQATPVVDTARRQLVLRVAQEMLAAASREPAASTLTVHGEGELVLELTQTDDDQIINLIPPTIDSDLVEVQSAQGLRITVRSD